MDDDHRLLAVGGLKHALVYDADAGTWTAATAPPVAIPGSDLVLLPDEHVLAVAGGVDLRKWLDAELTKATQ